MANRRAGVLDRWVVGPVKDLLKTGTTPELLAWSLAAGIVVGVNPLLGSTTLITLALAGCFRLNVVASQLGTHLVYPLELALFPVFVKVGSLIFGTQRLPLRGRSLWEAVKHHPVETTRVLWRWEWHALVVWVAFAAVAMPLIAAALCPLLTRMLRRLKPRERSVLEA